MISTTNQNIIKKRFSEYFLQKMKEEQFLSFIYEILSIGTAYVVGGFFRDFLNNKTSRDIDIIVELPSQYIITLLIQHGYQFTQNRQGGLKIKLENIEADIWSIDNNWAFANKLVRLNEDDKLHSISKGCFYNYDALVINLSKFNYNLRYYKDFIENKKLNILQERTLYKSLNPSIEANILRAFYIKKKYNIEYTDNTTNYLYSKIGDLQDKFGNPMARLIETRSKYPKYINLTDDYISHCIKDVKKIHKPHDLTLFEIND